MQKVWKILSIDGGGIRGIIPAIILASIEKRTEKPISQLFDLIAGTSTGGILALGLTKPDPDGKPEFSAQRLCELYERDIPDIFRNPRSWWGNLLGPKYMSHAFQQVLINGFGDCRLKSALTDVLIPCYDIEHRLPYMFKSRLARQESEYDFQMKDVALAASASPTLFYPVRIPRSKGVISLVDGGVFANNPSINALSEMKSISTNENDLFLVVSLGTGKMTHPLSRELLSLWGYVQWSHVVLEIVMESISESVHDQMQHLLSPTISQGYYRLQVDLSQANSAIDNASSENMQALSRAAHNFCSAAQSGRQLDMLCESLLSLSEQRSSIAPNAMASKKPG
jgi:uncharacterized protein